MKYYVYGLVDPRDQKIKYIGKGSGRRMFVHVSNARNDVINDHNLIKYGALKEILKEFKDIAYCKLFETDDEIEAYKHETVLIKQHNTIAPKGWNLLCGQIGTLSGKNAPMYGKTHSKETKEKISKTKSNPSKELRKRLSEMNKGRAPWNKGKKCPESEGDKNPFYGKTHSAESRKKMSNALKGEKHPLFGKTRSEQTKQKISNANKGERNGMFDKPVSKETRKKISESVKRARARKKSKC